MKTLIDNYFGMVKKTLDNLDRDEIENFIKVVCNARDKGNFIYIMGNGGSGGTASHFVCDFNKGMSKDESRFRMVCLNDNAPTLLAYANDISYDAVFVEQLKNFLNKDDVVIGISGSGNSKNVLNAIEYANEKGGITVGITGYDGGKLKTIAKHSINANINDMQVTEDIHMIICHLLYNILAGNKNA